MDALVAARKQVNEDLRRRFGSKAIKLSFLPFIIKVGWREGGRDASALYVPTHQSVFLTACL